MLRYPEASLKVRSILHHSFSLKAFAVLTLVSQMHGCFEGVGGGESVPRSSHADLKNPLFSFLLSILFPPLSSWEGTRCYLFAVCCWCRLRTMDRAPPSRLCSCLFADVHLAQGLVVHSGSTPQSPHWAGVRERGPSLLLSPISARWGWSQGSA